MAPTETTDATDTRCPIPPPPPRRQPGPQDRWGRSSTLELRVASQLPLWWRIQRQTERDALVHRLRRIDDRLDDLSAERRAIVDELAAVREDLYPPVPWCRGRRPPDIDRAPLPPAPAGAQVLRGRALRSTCLSILRRHGALGLRELHGLLHRYGYLVGAARPVTALSDAMAYETERGRARRTGHGVYEAVAGTERADRPGGGPGLPPQPGGPWSDPGPSHLDPDLDADPSGWGAQPASRSPDGVLGIPVAVAGRPGQQHHVDQELEEAVVVAHRRGRDVGPLGDEPIRHRRPEGIRAHHHRPAGDGQRILVVRGREAVEREASVADQVAALGRRDDEREQPSVVHDRAHRVHPRPTVGPHRGQHAEPHTELVQQAVAGLGQVGPAIAQLTPGSHAERLATPRARVKRGGGRPAASMGRRAHRDRAGPPPRPPPIVRRRW